MGVRLSLLSLLGKQFLVFSFWFWVKGKSMRAAPFLKLGSRRGDLED